ncbi:MAG TPA: hypothetical protein VGG61_11505 [Gemmataceae bacterium]|jgi:hypothetical protein
MATFYLLPAPRFLGRAFARHLQVLFPGLHWEESALDHVVEHVTETAGRHANVFLIHQHELPENVDVLQSLVDAFGAEPGDTVIEMHAGAKLGEWRIRQRVVNQAA